MTKPALKSNGILHAPSLFVPFIVALFTIASGQSLSFAAELVSLEAASEKLQSSTVTLRVTPKPAEAEGDNSAEDAKPKVSVFSAVCLGDGKLVTPLFEGADAQIRVTLPGGPQATAKPIVFDEHSGLALLQMTNRTMAGIDLSKDSPRVGSWAVSAAAWGAEPAVVSAGIISGVDRSLPGANYPSLLQLDLRIADTSSGAGVANSEGELLGVIVATEAALNKKGFTYAIPVAQIKRLLKAHAAKPPLEDGVLIIQKRRAIVGMKLTGGLDAVVIERITAGGPAEKAGLKKGDEVVAVDGVNIRSVYQAIRPIMYKQPGDDLTFVVQQKDGLRSITVRLGGGVVVPSAPKIQLSNYEQPRISIGGPARLTPLEHVAEVGVGSAARPAEVSGDTHGRAASNQTASTQTAAKMALLEKALDGYRNAIVVMRGDLTKQKQQKAELESELKKMQEEISHLREQLEAATSQSVISPKSEE